MGLTPLLSIHSRMREGPTWRRQTLIDFAPRRGDTFDRLKHSTLAAWMTSGYTIGDSTACR